MLIRVQMGQSSNILGGTFYERYQLSGSVQTKATALLKEKKAATFSFITLQFRQKDLKHWVKVRK